MPFCLECGKPIAAKAKFCRECGASQAEALSEEAVPAPEAMPAPETPPVAPAPGNGPAPLTCPSCGSAIAPDEKFCGTCGAKIGGVPRPEPAPAPVSSTPPAVFCPACGTSNPPGMKFCGSCGAPMAGVAPPPPSPPVMAPPMAPMATAPAGPRLCTACGNPIQPGEKYCSKCLVMVKDTAPAPPPYAPASYPPPPPPPPPAMAQVAAAPAGTRLCTACGNPIRPGDKFCSKCLVTVKDPAPPAAPPMAPAAPPQQSSGSYACASCGSPLSGNEKFCGVCGATAVAAAPVNRPGPAAMVCSACGAPITATTKFCGTCGAPAGASSPPVQVTAQPTGESIMGIIPNAQKMRMMGLAADTFTIIVTDRRMILAQLTQAMMNTAITEAQAKAKAEGKGFFGVWADQLSASFGFAKRYETMPPDAALAETPGNFALDNSRIRLIKVSEVRSNDDDSGSNKLRLKIDAAEGSFEYVISEDDRFTALLQNVYGDRVKMPFGLFKAGPVRIKFF